MNLLEDLTVEQALELHIIKGQAKELSLEQAQLYIVEVVRQMMIRDNLVGHLLKTARPSTEQF